MNTILKIIQVTVEAVTALSIGSGRTHGHEDAPVTLDHLGLPFIPGTSLAGVIRSIYRTIGDDDTLLENPFGYAGVSVEGEDAARSKASRIEVSNGFVHGSDGKPAVRPQLSRETGRCADPLLAYYQQTFRKTPLLRHRVKLTEKGVSDSKAAGLFDRSVVPAGSRFTFEICLSCDSGDQQRAEKTWERLLVLLGQSTFRLGGATRSGLGALCVRAKKEWSFDLSKPQDYQAYAGLAADLQAFRINLDAHLPTNTSAVRDNPKAPHTYALKLKAEDFWRIGNSDRPVSQGTDADEADLAPYVERKIVWKSQDSQTRARWDEDYLLIPASSVKGALRHRTTFHLCRLMKAFADPDNDTQLSVAPEVAAKISDLFGQVKKDKSGSVGRVIIDDAYIPVAKLKFLTLVHNSIDRFTGGVRDGFLYGEQMAWQGEFELFITLTDRNSSSEVEKAFEMAIEDLNSGRLTLGAAAGRGHGRLSGEYTRRPA